VEKGGSYRDEGKKGILKLRGAGRNIRGSEGRTAIRIQSKEKSNGKKSWERFVLAI